MGEDAAVDHDDAQPPQTSGWVAVRAILASETPEGRSYEERVTLWRESSMDVAIERAEAEADRYAADLGGTTHLGLMQAYLLSDEPGDGAEVFSLMRRSDLGPGPYLDRFFDTGQEHQADVAR